MREALTSEGCLSSLTALFRLGLFRILYLIGVHLFNDIIPYKSTSVNPFQTE